MLGKFHYSHSHTITFFLKIIHLFKNCFNESLASLHLTLQPAVFPQQQLELSSQTEAPGCLTKGPPWRLLAPRIQHALLLGPLGSLSCWDLISASCPLSLCLSHVGLCDPQAHQAPPSLRPLQLCFFCMLSAPSLDLRMAGSVLHQMSLL